ncbi:hypothetical protein C5F47_08885 [Nitrosopumilus cobalaminigenes]|uniref:Uncharacterized protein n=1 Tax=Nitrosopumilus cobalaminigenes TaxID=1470066 RepID=A0A7D5R6Z6_9ARCH|nr:hypothetical protein [Nitrosopumilus cobalaminigenes]QLH03644.1 hypothetical protein C5F47_08885 [Nitrosopumilus cobalaminigenes]
MTEKNSKEIPVKRLTETRITLENRPVGPDETREIGFTLKAEEKPVGLETPLKIKIRYDEI